MGALLLHPSIPHTQCGDVASWQPQAVVQQHGVRKAEHGGMAGDVETWARHSGKLETTPRERMRHMQTGKEAPLLCTSTTQYRGSSKTSRSAIRCSAIRAPFPTSLLPCDTTQSHCICEEQTDAHLLGGRLRQSRHGQPRKHTRQRRTTKGYGVPISHQAISSENQKKTRRGARRRPVRIFWAPPGPRRDRPEALQRPRQGPVGYGFWNPPRRPPGSFS